MDEFRVCRCNCTKANPAGTILVNSTQEQPDVQVDEQEIVKTSAIDSDDDIVGFVEETDLDIDSSLDDENNIKTKQLFTAYFELKGISFHDCQRTLKECKRKELDDEQVDLRVTAEPNNTSDRNAIIVE